MTDTIPLDSITIETHLRASPHIPPSLFFLLFLFGLHHERVTRQFLVREHVLRRVA